MQTDIEIQGDTFYAITGQSETGTEWINSNVQGAEDGSAYTDGRQFAKDIADGAIDDNLVVIVNGRQYLGNNRVA